MEFAECLLEQAVRHPSTQEQDVLKQCYQAAFGAAHLQMHRPEQEKRFYEEFEAVPADGQAFAEQISPTLCRVNLSAWKQHHLPPEWLFRLCGLAKIPEGDAEALFLNFCQQAGTLAEMGKLPIDASKWEKLWRQYDRQRRPPVRHSGRYRKLEKPSYRLVPVEAIRLLPLLQRLTGLLVHKQVAVVAIDGRAASGKTTMAEQLATVLQAGVVHMDDFFLPPDLRTPQRLAEPGGNVHYERFLQEVLPHLQEPEAFSYRCFDCGTMDFHGQRTVSSDRWRIVEGSYSMHPRFGRYMDLCVFSMVDSQEQIRRIRRRNGAEMAQVFEQHWIPLEETYFSTYQVSEKSDLIL